MSKRKELLVHLLKDPESDVRSAAAAALEALENAQGLDAVLEQLKKGNIPEKVRAINALGMIGGEKVLKPLIYCATRPENDLKAAAIDALGHLAARPAIPVLLENLKDSNSGIVAKAVRALGSFRDSAFIPHLLPMLEMNDGLLDIEAALALGKTGEPSLEEPLMKLAGSPLAAVRVAAVTALGMLRPA